MNRFHVTREATLKSLATFILSEERATTTFAYVTIKDLLILIEKGILESERGKVLLYKGRDFLDLKGMETYWRISFIEGLSEYHDGIKEDTFVARMEISQGLIISYSVEPLYP